MFKKVLFILSVVFLFSAMAHNAFADVSAQLEQAQAYVNNREYEQAEAIYKTIVQDYPGTDDALEAQRRLTQLYIFWKKEPEAEAAFEEVLAEFSQEESTIDAVIQVADIYSGQGKHQEALELYQDCLNRLPDGEQAIRLQLGMAISNIALGNDSDTQVAIEQLLAEFSDSEHIAEAVADIAESYRKSGRCEEAVQFYQYALANWPGSEETMWSQAGLARSNIALGDDPNAQAATDKLLTEFSDNNGISEAIYEIADEYLSLEKYEKANQVFQYVLDNRPRADEAIWSHAGIAMSKIGVDDDANALAAVDSLISDFNDHPELQGAVSSIAEQYYNRAFQMEKEELADQAQNYFQKAIAIYEIVADELPSTGDVTPEACCLVGVCYRKLGEYEKSIEYYQKVVDDYPGHRLHWYALFMVGRNYEDLKKSGGVSSSEADTKIKAAYEQLLEKYPACKAARYARYWLSRHNSK